MSSPNSQRRNQVQDEDLRPRRPRAPSPESQHCDQFQYQDEAANQFNLYPIEYAQRPRPYDPVMMEDESWQFPPAAAQYQGAPGTRLNPFSVEDEDLRPRRPQAPRDPLRPSRAREYQERRREIAPYPIPIERPMALDPYTPQFEQGPPFDPRFEQYQQGPPFDPRYEQFHRGLPFDPRFEQYQQGPPYDPRYEQYQQGPPYDPRYEQYQQEPPFDPHFEQYQEGPPYDPCYEQYQQGPPFDPHFEQYPYQSRSWSPTPQMSYQMPGPIPRYNAPQEPYPYRRRARSADAERTHVPNSAPRRSRSYDRKPAAGPQIYWQGIQGYMNSCYMDVSLFSMFAYTDAFLIQPTTANTTRQFAHISAIVRLTIVPTLRRYGYISATMISAFRKKMAREVMKMPADRIYDMKDADAFFIPLLQQVFEYKPLLELSFAGNESDFFSIMLYTTPVNHDFPSMQMLLDQYCTEFNMKFRKMPQCLILIMMTGEDHERGGARHNVYPRIFPNKMINIESHMTGGQNRRNYLLELSSAICIASGHYQSYNVNRTGDWINFNSMSVLQQDGITYIPHIRPVRGLSRVLDDYEGACNQNQHSPSIEQLFKSLYVCFYIRPDVIR